MPSPVSGTSWARRCAGLVLVLVVSLAATACQSPSSPSASPERLSRNDAQATLASHPVLVWRSHALRDRRRPGRLLWRPKDRP